MKKFAIALCAAMGLASMASAEVELIDEGGNWMVTYGDKVEQCVIHAQDDTGALLVGHDSEGTTHFNFFLLEYIGENPQVMLSFVLPDAPPYGPTKRLKYEKTFDDYYAYSLEAPQKYIDLFWVGEVVSIYEFGKPGTAATFRAEIPFSVPMHQAFYECLETRL